jgi:hypothetical protein
VQKVTELKDEFLGRKACRRDDVEREEVMAKFDEGCGAAVMDGRTEGDWTDGKGKLKRSDRDSNLSQNTLSQRFGRQAPDPVL